MRLGKKLRELRDANGLLLREVAAKLEMDTAMISKIERGEKKCKKEQLSILAELYDASEKELTILWISDSLILTVKNEKYAAEALKETIKLVRKN